MTYQQVLENARTCIGPYCKACNDCNGKVCRNTMPGPGAKGEGTGFIRNAEKWREICVNMDTICENSPVDTSFTLFGRTFEIPAFAAPVGAMRLHYGASKQDKIFIISLVYLEGSISDLHPAMRQPTFYDHHISSSSSSSS